MSVNRGNYISCPLCGIEMENIIVDKMEKESHESVKIRRIPGIKCPKCGQSWFSFVPHGYWDTVLKGEL